MAVVPKMPGHLAHSEERRLHELPVDQRHQAQVLGALSGRAMVEGRTRDRQQPALRGDRQPRMALLYLARLTSRPKASAFATRNRWRLRAPDLRVQIAHRIGIDLGHLDQRALLEHAGRTFQQCLLPLVNQRRLYLIQQATVVEPVDPLEGGELQRLEASP